MRKYVLFAVATLIGFAAVSCQKVEIEPDDALSIAGTTITVGKDAATPTVTFTANKAWSVTSDSQWIVPDQTSGDAGTVTLKLAVEENDTWAERSGKVTIAVGELKTVVTVVQGTESLFATSSVLMLTPDAQDINIPVSTNLSYTVTPAEDSPWISVVSTKAAPTEGTITIHVAANTELAPRAGSFEIAAPGYSQTYSVVQDASWTPAVSAEAVYIANSQSIYDSETWAINLHQQYVVKLTTGYGDQVTLVLNKKGTYNDKGEFEFLPTDKVPQGTFEIDATGTKADNTFSIMSSTGEEKYYTNIVVDGREVLVYDGEIVVAEADGTYTVTAILVDAAGQLHSYSYVGALAITNDFRGGNATVDWKNTYDTHFTTKANGWYVSFYLPRKNPADMTEAAYASFTFYSAAGEVDLNELPAGTYTYGEPENDATLKYAHGIAKATPGMLTNVSVSLYNEAGTLVSTTAEAASTVLTITKNADGTKNFKYSGTVKPYSYDENWNVVYGNPVAVNIDIDVPVGTATDTASKPRDDKDDEFASLDGPGGSTYVGYWFSKYIGSENNDRKEAIAGTDCNIFSFGSNSDFNGAWSMMLTVIADAGWTFEKNFANRYCATPIPDGTYTFGAEAKIGAIIPLRYSTASRCYVTNKYTGTTYYPVAGTVTLNKGTIAVDLTCKATEASLEGRPNSPASVKLTGGTEFTCYYLQDWSALSRVKNISINSPVAL